MTVACIVLAVSVAGGVAALLWLRDGWGLTMAGFTAVLVASLVAGGAAAWMLTLHYDRAACRSWGHKTGRPARFAYYTAFSWDCLTRTHDGKWISTDQVGDFNK